MKDLHKKAWGGLIFFIVALALLLFIPAGTIFYWQAWLYLFSFGASVTAITIYLMGYDPKLLARRIAVGTTAEKEKSQKIIQFFAQFVFIAIFLVPALDHRFLWSHVPTLLTVIGDALVVAGFSIVFLVFKENSFTSATIEVDKKQKVITTGPYAAIRHPMYSGALLMLAASSIALGSWWGLVAFIPMIFVIIVRLLHEETYLTKHLDGYMAYCKKTHYRLLPFVW